MTTKRRPGAQPGNTNAAAPPGTPVSRRCQFRLYPDDEKRLAEVARLYENKSEAVRAAIALLWATKKRTR